MPPTVLIVEDEPAMSGFLVDCLANLGCDLQVAADGFQALQLMRSRPPAVVLLDIMMPGMGGWELARRIRSDPQWQNLPIIVCTARRESRASASLVQAILYKPFDLEELRQQVKKWLAV